MLAAGLGFLFVALSLVFLFIIIIKDCSFQKAFSLFLPGIIVILLFVWLRKTGRLFFTFDYVCAMKIFAHGAIEPELCLELGWSPQRARRMLDILVRRGWIDADVSAAEGPWLVYYPTTKRLVGNKDDKGISSSSAKKLSGNDSLPSGSQQEREARRQ